MRRKTRPFEAVAATVVLSGAGAGGVDVDGFLTTFAWSIWIVEQRVMFITTLSTASTTVAIFDVVGAETVEAAPVFFHSLRSLTQWHFNECFTAIKRMGVVTNKALEFWGECFLDGLNLNSKRLDLV